MSSGSKKTANSASEAIEILWHEGVFKLWKKFNEVSLILGKRGNNFSKPELGIALKGAKFLIRRGRRGSYEYIQRMPSINIEVEKIEDEIFSKELIERLTDRFSKEIADLKLNYGKSGTCSAFLFRKLLEKLIFLTFAKNGLSNQLKDVNGKFIGLESMINLASSEKVGGFHFLMPKTASNIKGIKFLGDTSVHNPMINVDMKTIIPQMPFIITAFEELSKKL